MNVSFLSVRLSYLASPRICPRLHLASYSSLLVPYTHTHLACLRTSLALLRRLIFSFDIRFRLPSFPSLCFAVLSQVARLGPRLAVLLCSFLPARPSPLILDLLFLNPPFALNTLSSARVANSQVSSFLSRSVPYTLLYPSRDIPFLHPRSSYLPTPFSLSSGFIGPGGQRRR